MQSVRTFSRTLLSVFGSLFIGACASSHDFTVAAFDPVEAPIYPVIDVFRLNPSPEFRGACAEFDKKSALHHCTLNNIDFSKLTAAINNTGYFESALLASRDQPYSVAFSVAAYDAESAGELGKAALAGATLLLIPVSTSAILKVEGVVRWNSEPLHEFGFDLPFTLHGSWQTLSEDVDAGLSESIASHFIEDLKQADVFSANFLNSKLGASNYEAELSAPNEVGNFQKIGVELLSNPFQGARVHYEHSGYEAVWADVFVYPIRAWQYEEEANLAKEIEATQRDLELMAKEGFITSLDISDDVSTIKSAGNSVSIANYSAAYNAGDQKGLSSRTFVFTRADKFVKVRVTFGRYVPIANEIDSFAISLADLVTVPEESLFMARLRKQWRDGGSN